MSGVGYSLNVVNGPSESMIEAAYQNQTFLTDARNVFYTDNGFAICMKIRNYGFPQGDSTMEILGVIDQVDHGRMSRYQKTQHINISARIVYDPLRKVGKVYFNNEADLAKVRI